MLPISKEEFMKLSDDEKWKLLCEALKELQELHLEREFEVGDKEDVPTI